MDRNPQASVEWPTLGLISLTFLVWGGTIAFAETLTLYLAIPILVVALTLHSSLQHEVIHGHPFRNRILGELLIWPGLGLFVPYGRFRDLHLAHHKDSDLTDPYDDPESFYFDESVYHTLPNWVRFVLAINNTLVGRLIIGPLVGTEGYLRTEIWQALQGDIKIWRDWAIHLASFIPIFWLVSQGTLPIWAYILSAYMAMSVLKLRTYAEHRAHEQSAGRSVIIEDRGIFAFLFLNNNFHAVHHAYPQVPWYDIPALYRSRKGEFLARNRNYLFKNYREVFGKFALRQKEPVPHPIPKSK